MTTDVLPTTAAGYKLIPLARLLEIKENQKKLPQLMKAPYPCAVSKASLRPTWPCIYDQGPIGSCTANAFCSCFKFVNRKKKFDPSRMYVYYKERLLECGGRPDQITDSGAWVADGRKWAHEHGVCAEYLWPYNVDKVNDAPPEFCDSDAYYHKCGASYAITSDTLNAVKTCICKGEPVMMAFGVYRSFTTEMPAGAIAPVPHPKAYQSYNDPQDPFEGGHEVVIIGYDDAKQLLTVANSWGEQWGDKGFFYMPYAFFTNNQLVYALDVLSAFSTELD